jgi:hypothetical protein
MNADSLIAPLMALTIPDGEALKNRALASLESAREIVIDGPPMYQIAVDELRGIKAGKKQLEDDRRSFTDPLNAVVKAINDRYRPAVQFHDEAETIVKQAMVAYQNKLEAEQAEAKRIAEAAAAAERQRLAEEAAERQRIADAELHRLADEAKAAEAAGDAARAAQLGNEVALVAHSAAAEVAAIEQTAALVVAAPIAAPAPKASGVSTAKGCDFEVQSLAHVLVFIVTGQTEGNVTLAHPEYLDIACIDEVKLRGLVRSLGMNLKMPGVRVFPKKTVRVAA